VPNLSIQVVDDALEVADFLVQLVELGVDQDVGLAVQLFVVRLLELFESRVERRNQGGGVFGFSTDAETSDSARGDERRRPRQKRGRGEVLHFEAPMIGGF